MVQKQAQVRSASVKNERSDGEQSGGHTQRRVPWAGNPSRAIAGGAAVLGVGALEMDGQAQADDEQHEERKVVHLYDLALLLKLSLSCRAVWGPREVYIQVVDTSWTKQEEREKFD